MIDLHWDVSNSNYCSAGEGKPRICIQAPPFYKFCFSKGLFSLTESNVQAKYLPWNKNYENS